MFWNRKASAGVPKIEELTPSQVQAALAQGKVVLVDVREVSEHAAERIPGFREQGFAQIDLT